MLALFVRSHVGSEVMQRSPETAAKLAQKAPSPAMFTQPGTLAQLAESIRLAATRAADAANIATHAHQVAQNLASLTSLAAYKAQVHSDAMQALAAATEALALAAAEDALRDDMQ